jgi:tetratricopeptide (TPR) repeat protein
MLGEYRGAAEALDEALTLYRDLGDPRGESAALTEQGALLRISGDLTGAQEHCQRALDLARSASSPLHEAGALAGLGSCASAAGDTAQATVLLRQAYEGFLSIGSPDADDVRAELEGLTGEAPSGES